MSTQVAVSTQSGTLFPQCLICADDRRAVVERLLLAGVTYSEAARRSGQSYSSVYRHALRHMPEMQPILEERRERSRRGPLNQTASAFHAPDGVYQAVFEPGLPPEAMAAATQQRAERAELKVTGDVTFETHRLSYRDQFATTLVVATVEAC